MNNKKNLLIPTLIISIALTAYIVLAATQSIHTPVTGGNYSGTITFNVSTNTTRCNACRNATIYYNSSGAINVKDKAVLTNLTTLTNNTANDVSFNGTISVTSLGDLPTYSFAALLDNGTKQNWTGVVSSITIDNTGPNVSINAPVNNLNTSSESLVLNATVNDSLSSVQAVYFNLTNSTGQQAFTNATEIGKNYNVTLNTSSYKDGSYVFTVYANDSLGNLNKTENITINIDSTVPSITLTKKDSGKHSLSITISVSDTTGVNGLCTTDRSTTVTGRSTTTQTTNESGLSCGSTYDYTVTCTDYVGNSNAATSSFTTSSCSGGGGGGTTSSYWGMTYAPNKEQVSEGYEKTMREKQRVRVSVNNREHYVGVLAVSENTATINVSSDPQQATLTAGQEEKFEVTDDNYYDLLVKLNSIVDSEANLTIKSIHEEITEQEETTEETEEAEAEEEAEEETGSMIWLWALIVIVIAVVIYVLYKQRQ